MKFSRIIVCVAAALAMLLSGSYAQSVETLSSSNVTAWSAQLYAGYSGLTTGSTYSGTIFYGQADGGTNELSWTGYSSSFDMEPSGTDDVAGVFSHVVVGLSPTNTYYYRARIFDFDSFESTWATQSLTFVTRNQAPTSMPGVAYASVTVDTNGVLHTPPDFFEKNGIVPTSGVVEIFARLGSNEVAIATLFAGKLDFATSTGLFLRVYDRAANDRAIVSSLIITNGPDFSESEVTLLGGDGKLTASLFSYGSYGWLRLRTAYGDTALLGRGAGGVYDWRISSNDTSNAKRIFNEGFMGPGSGMDADTVDGRHGTNLVLWSGGNVTATTFNVTDQFTVGTNGADVIVHYKGFGNLVIMTGSSTTSAVFNGTSVSFLGQRVSAGAITATNGISYFGATYGNGLGWTNIPLGGLRLSNIYTGGVMRLVTTDGITFFLQ